MWVDYWGCSTLYKLSVFVAVFLYSVKFQNKIDNNMAKICLIYNFAQHYRTNIFTLDQQLNVDFVFVEKYLDMKKMDYSLLRYKTI